MISMSNEDVSEKTSIVNSDTFSGRMRQADEAPPALVVLMGPGSYVGKQFALEKSEYILGRSHECSIQIDDKSVSRNHARIQVVGGEVSISDMGSANKTVINGTTLQAGVPFKLRNNDQIKTGNIIMKFLEKGNIEAFTNRELNEKATRDALTGAHTKGSLLERGPEVMKRAETLNEDVSVIVFDIDFFKKINDQFGHPAGDHVLKELGRIVGTKLTRAHDFFARYGGEEFVIILIGAPLKSASEVAERIRTTIQGTTFQFENTVIPVTVSVGVATRLPNENGWDAFFKRADEALYASKQGGRNRVTIANGNSL
jgi:diguanylate cyclase (GGDEF)-like protein